MRGVCGRLGPQGVTFLSASAGHPGPGRTPIVLLDLHSSLDSGGLSSIFILKGLGLGFERPVPCLFWTMLFCLNLDCHSFTLVTGGGVIPRLPWASSVHQQTTDVAFLGFTYQGS